jgi:hypothetical protein
MSENNKPEKSDKRIHKLRQKENQPKLILGLLVVLVLILLAFVLSNRNNSDNDQNNGPSVNTTTNASGDAKLYLKPSSQDVKAGSSITLEVWVDTGDVPVNAVQANLSYPADKFDFNSIDAKESAFEIQAMSTGGKGKINIARGHVGDVKGPNLIAKVILVAKSNKGDAQVNFIEGSAIVTSNDHKNILKDKPGGTFKISKVQSPVAIIQVNKAG